MSAASDPNRAARVAEHVRSVARMLDAYKLDRGCADCGYCGHPSALQFDHTDPATKRDELGWKRDRSKLTSHAKVRRYLEHVERYCVIRCANCHAERTARERHWMVRDGQKPLDTAEALW